MINGVAVFIITSTVSVSYVLNPDPDPACWWIRIHSGSGSGSRPWFMITKFGKNYDWKTFLRSGYGSRRTYWFIVTKFIENFITGKFLFKIHHIFLHKPIPWRFTLSKIKSILFSFFGGQFRNAWIQIRVLWPNLIRIRVRSNGYNLYSKWRHDTPIRGFCWIWHYYPFSRK
jgi:hypothetical protein